MEFGMFHEFPSLPGRTDGEAFDEAMAQVDAAERLGLDVMWLAELHFEPRRSVLSAPLSIASAIAARTRHIKIGIAVQVLPLCHPLRLAGEAAGHTGQGQVFVSAPTYLAETDDAALAEPRDSIMHFYHEQANLLEGAARLVDPETAARRMRRVEQLRRVDYDEAVRTNALVGSPDTIAEQLRALQTEIGLSGILAELNCGGLIPHQRVIKAMQLLCEAVKPRFAA